jgi:hypothetical protein
MAANVPTIPRGKYLGKLVDPETGKPVEAAEADHFTRCPACGGVIDVRDLAIVLAHLRPLPHPAGDKPQ